MNSNSLGVVPNLIPRISRLTEAPALRCWDRRPVVSLTGLPRDAILSARRIHERAAIGANVPVVVFCIEEIAEGEEVPIGQNVSC